MVRTMGDLSSDELHVEQVVALEHILAAYERDDTIDEEYGTAKLLAADGCDRGLGEGFNAIPLVNSEGFSFRLP